MKILIFCCVVAIFHWEVSLAARFLTKDYLSDYEFVIQVNDPAVIDEARRIIAGEVEQPDSWHFKGNIVKSPAPYNPGWSFHIDPNGPIFFGQYFIEVCDAVVEYVEDHLEEACGAFLPGCRWCPWGSYLVKEIEED